MIRKFLLGFFAIGLLQAVPADELPDTIQVTSGDVEIELGARVFWNLNGIRYQGKSVCQKGKGFYGTVLSFSGLGWVGTGHLENKIGETEIKCEFTVDGKPWAPAAEPVKCNRFEMKKSSLLYQVRVEYRLLVENNRIREDVKLTAEKDSKLGVVYHFMHPWEPMFTEYLLCNRDGQEDRDVFSDKNLRIIMPFLKPDWASFYAPAEQLGLLSVVRDTSNPPVPADEWLIWNRGRDRKLYYVAARKADWKAGHQASAGMITAFFPATPENWQKQASEQASALKGLWK
jgi:hypothetical protein